MTLERLLNSVGKRTFVKYYYNFKNHSRQYCISNFDEPFTEKAKASKTGHAQMVFKNRLEKDALVLISKSNRVDETTKEKALEILSIDFQYK
ncbi:MAG: hypothetical protein E7513_05030 [Ruminococcaceae bacterium]|nr:hypothetical protein [Oscillospiraceae bacterium]